MSDIGAAGPGGAAGTVSASTRAGAGTAPSTATLAALFVLLFGVSQVPLYAIEYVDIRDFPNHLARFHVLAHLGESGVLQRYYVATPHAIFPNLGMEAIVPLLARVLETGLALKVFGSLAALLMTTGAVALGRVFVGRVGYLTLGAALFANNVMFQFGLFNYLFGLGLALWLLAAWLCAPRLRATPAGMLLFAAGATAIYLCHLSAWAVYAVATVTLQANWALRSRDAWSARLRAASAAILPLLPALVVHLALSAPPVGDGYTSSHSSLLALVAYKLALFALAPGAAFSGYAAEGALLGATAGSAVYFGLRHGVLRLSPDAARVAAVLAVCMALLPPAIFGSALADSRLLVPAALVLWSGLELERTAWPAPVPAALFCLALAASGATAWEWHIRDGEYREVRHALGQLPEGAKVATVTLNGGNTHLSPHLSAWAVIDRSVFLANLYTRPFQPVWLQFAAPYTALAAKGRTGNVAPTPFSALQGHFDYIVIVGTPAARAAYGAPGPALYATDAVEIVSAQHVEGGKSEGGRSRRTGIPANSVSAAHPVQERAVYGSARDPGHRESR